MQNLKQLIDPISPWSNFLDYIKTQCSSTAFNNWFGQIKAKEIVSDKITLQVPNLFVKEYLLTNYQKELTAFLPTNETGEPNITFEITAPNIPITKSVKPVIQKNNKSLAKLNPLYTFDDFIEGPSNQFVKSAAIGVANRPGKHYNPLFIYGGVGLGKTHLLHSIGHHIQQNNKKLRVQCITTEEFINELVDNLKNKTVEKLKRFYRSQVDVLLVDDIQFLEHRLNFEEELCSTFEALINQNKQIVITSDKPPSQLKLSERITARLGWGLVANVGVPDLETRVAILQHKAEQKGLAIKNEVAFFIAEHIYNNVRQLEGAVNKLNAHCKLLNLDITEQLVEQTLSEMLHKSPTQKISVEDILKSVATIFQVRVSDLKGSARTKDIALPRQVAMYLAYKLINESLQMLGASFGKTHSTILHACKNVEKKVVGNDALRRQISMVERSLAA